MKRLLLFIFLLLISQFSFADDANSPKQALSRDLIAFASYGDSMMVENSQFLFNYYKPNDSIVFTPARIRIAALVLASNLQIETENKRDLSKKQTFVRAEQLAISNGEQPFLIYLLNDFGLKNYNNSKFGAAIQFYKQAISFADTVGNDRGQVLSLNNLGFLHQDIGDYDLANQYFLEAKDIAEKNHLYDEYYHALNGLCNVQYLVENYDESFEYILEARQIIKKLKKTDYLVDNYRKIGKLFFSKKDYDHAISYYLMSIDAGKADTLSSMIEKCYNELGLVYLEKNNFRKALYYLELSLEKAQSKNNQTLVILNHIYIGQILSLTGDAVGAMSRFEKAVSLSKGISYLFGLRKVYFEIYKLKKKSNDVDAALKYLELFEDVNKQLLDETRLSAISQMHALYDRTTSTENIKILTEKTHVFEEENQRQRISLYTTMIWLVIAMVALFVIVYILRWKIKNNLVLQEKNEEISKAHAELQSKEQELETLNKDLEKKVANRTRQLQKANNQLAGLEKAKSEFLEIISHELRTPLTGILGLTHLLTQTSTSVEQKKYMTNLSDVSKRLVRFSEVALLITSLRSKNQSVELFDVSVRILVEMAIDELKVMIENKKANIEVNIENRDMMIVADSTLITKSICLLIESILLNTPSNGKIVIHAFETETENLIEFLLSFAFSEKVLGEMQSLINGEIFTLHENGNFSLAAVKLIQDAHGGTLQVCNIDEESSAITLVFKK